MPKIDRTRLPYQNVAASQKVSLMFFEEKEPITAAAKTVHWPRGVSEGTQHEIEADYYTT